MSLTGRFLLVTVILVVTAVAAYYTWQMIRSANNSGFENKDQNEVVEYKPVVLDKKKQKQIWDNEHITFALEQRFGKALLQALIKKDPQRVKAYFRAGCQGQVLIPGKGSTRSKDFLVETQHTSATAKSTAVGVDQLTSALLAPMQRFEEVQRQRLRVLRIKQLSQQPPRWQAKLLLEYVGTAKDKKAQLYQSYHQIECTITDDTKIDRTALIDRWQVKSETWRDSDRHFLEEVTKDLGLDQVDISDNWKLDSKMSKLFRFQLAVADYNKDGWLDIAVAVVDAEPLLLESVQGKKFKNVAKVLGLKGVGYPRVADCFAAAWFDYDNDGWPDLLLANRLYHNLQGKRFEEVTERSGLVFHQECMGVVPADYDGDGRLDLYLLYQKDYTTDPMFEPMRWVDEGDTGKANQLWRNEGGGRFRDVTAETNAGGGERHSFAAAWFYYDDDHWPDLYIANDFGKNVVLRNLGGRKFVDVSKETGAEDYATSMGVAVGDVSGDGHTDLYVANMFSKMGRRIIGQVCEQDYPKGIFEQIKGSCAGNRLYLKQRGGRYREVGETMGVNSVGWAFGPALFDIDGDGWLDIYATTGFLSRDPKKPDG